MSFFKTQATKSQVDIRRRFAETISQDYFTACKHNNEESIINQQDAPKKNRVEKNKFAFSDPAPCQRSTGLSTNLNALRIA